MKSFLQNLRTLGTKYTLSQKIALGVTGVLVAALIWGAVYFANRIDFQVLYTDLEPQEAQGIVQKLQEAKIEYRLSDDGRGVSIPADKISETRIKLATSGLPSSGRIGFEIFDQTNFGLTNFQEQVNYQRALEGELARSIMTLSEVEAARVHLVLPKESLFQSAEDQTKASVILKLRNGRNLSENAVQGIVNVVASSVKGLTPERVTLIDYRGKVLSRPETQGSLTGQQLDAREKLETELATKIVQILEPAVGQGKVRPEVSVAMNFQQVEETTERYEPQASVVRSQQHSEDRQPQPPQPVGGIPGPKGVQAGQASPPAPNSAAAAAPVGPAQPNILLRQNETVNYEVSKAVRHTVEPVGKISHVSVAVIIDNHVKTATGSDGKPQITSEPRTTEEMTKYRDLVSAAIGLNPERGDRITVENVSFEGEVDFGTKEPTFIEKQAPLIIIGLRYLIVPVAVILIYLLFLRPVQKTVLAQLAAAPAAPHQQLVRSFPQGLASGRQTPMTVKQLEAQLQSGANAEFEPVSLSAPTKMDVIRTRVLEHAQQDPENVARLVKTWLHDERTR
jgi:flagellar M-ring protein FliF